MHNPSTASSITLRYLGGENQPNTSAAAERNATRDINLELSKRWGYLAALGNIPCSTNQSTPGWTPPCGWTLVA